MNSTAMKIAAGRPGTLLGNCYLVINPGSHHGRAASWAKRYEELLTADGANAPRSLDRGYTRDLEDARALAQRAIEAGYDTILAVGGDGTINRVIGALADARSAVSRPPRLGILYAGTSPDFCRFHGLPADPPAAVARLREGTALTIDACAVEHRDADGTLRTHVFASSANIGLGAGIAARANRWRPRLGDSAGTLAASLATILGRRPERMRLILDEEEIEIPAAWNVTIGKNPYLAGGLQLETGVRPNDGWMYVFALAGIGRARLLADLPRIYSGSIARDSRFLLRRARRARIETLDGDTRIEYDGDPAGWCPACIRVIPHAIELIGGRP